MPEMTKGEKLDLVIKQTEAGHALIIAGLVDDWLQKLLLTAGRKLPNEEAKNVFTGMGPLASFSGKIEVAYLFSLIDKPVRDDLRLIRRIRNNFAHTSRFVSFKTDHIAKDCRKLSNWKDGMDAQACYREKAFECVDLIKAEADVLRMAQALGAEPGVIMDDE
jgi:hypothetical protein